MVRPLGTLALVALAALAPSAWGRELSLEEALTHATANRDLRTVELQAAAARRGEGVARAAFDPTFVASTEVSGVDSAGFVAGFPMDSTSLGSTSTVGLRGSTSTGTAWEVGADLGYDHMTTVSSLGGVASEQVQKTWSGLVDLTVSQDVLAPFRQSATAIAARQASEQVDAAELAARRAEQDAVLAIADAWWSWSSAHRLAERSERAAVEARALEAQTQARHDEGQVAQLEVSRTTSERLAAERDVLSARAELRAAADRLLLVMGEAPGQAIEPAGEGAIAGGAVDLDGSLRRAMDANPDIAAARAEVDFAENALRDGRRSALPELTASGSLGMASLSDDAMAALGDLTSDSGLPRWAVGLDLSMPLGGRAARDTRGRAEAELDIAELALTSAEEELRADVRVAVDAVATGRVGVALAMARLEVASQTEVGEQARVDEGESRLDDLITARNARLAAEADVVEAESERARAELNLLRLEGRLGGPDGL